MGPEIPGQSVRLEAIGPVLDDLGPERRPLPDDLRGRRQGPAQRHARRVRTRLDNSRMDEIFKGGLHEFISGFIADNNRLGTLITEQYLL